MAKKKPTKKKKSSVRHTRAIQRDRSKRPLVAPPDEKIAARLTEVLKPTIEEQNVSYGKLGLRKRTLTLSVMVAIVVSMIWRQLGGGGTELARLLATEGLLWVPVLQVSQQAISERLRIFPPSLFFGLLQTILPVLNQRSQERKRPLPPMLAWANARYPAVLAADGSTLDSLMRKVGLLRESASYPLAGKTMAILNVCTWLPTHIWYDEDAKAHDQRFWPQLLQAIPNGALLLLDAGFANFDAFLLLKHITFIIPAKANLVYQRQRCLQFQPRVHDLLVWIGTGKQRPLIRLVSVYHDSEWYHYLTNELNPAHLPAERVAALSWQRWRIEDAFNICKRVLGLAYFWTGSVYGVMLQVWATWILYAILVDLTDDVADALDRPLADISIEMVFRSLYYFGQAFSRGDTDDPVAYLAANARRFGILKRPRKRARPILTFSHDP
jgi:hypothetical protein